MVVIKADLCNNLFLSSGVGADCHGVPGLHHECLERGRECLATRSLNLVTILYSHKYGTYFDIVGEPVALWVGIFTCEQYCIWSIERKSLTNLIELRTRGT